jgi:hypothetical protein
MLGICARGGYTSYAAQCDICVRAQATVSAAGVGRMTPNGGLHEEHKENSEAIAAALKAAGEWRTQEANRPTSGSPAMFEIDKPKSGLSLQRCSGLLRYQARPAPSLRSLGATYEL